MPHFFFYFLFLSCNGFTVFLERAQLSFSDIQPGNLYLWVLKDDKTELMLQMLLRAFCFISLPIYYHQLHLEERKSKNPIFIPIALAFSKAKEKRRTSNEAKRSLARECVGNLTHSEHLNCALTAFLCLYFCNAFNWKVLMLSCPQEEYEGYSMFLKRFEDEQSCPCRAVCDFIRKVQQGWKSYWFILLAVRVIFAAHWRKSCFSSLFDGLDCPVRLEPKQEVCDAWAVLYSRSARRTAFSLKSHSWLPTWPIHSWSVTSAN